MTRNTITQTPKTHACEKFVEAVQLDMIHIDRALHRAKRWATPYLLQQVQELDRKNGENYDQRVTNLCLIYCPFCGVKLETE